MRFPCRKKWLLAAAKILKERFYRGRIAERTVIGQRQRFSRETMLWPGSRRKKVKRGLREFPASVCKAVLAGIVCIGCAVAVFAQATGDLAWPTYGNDAGGTRYSTAAQIDRSNVDKLKVAWTYRTGALEQSKRLLNKAAFEATPILMEGKLFLSTPYNHVIALDPGTGEKLWEYDPAVNLERNYSEVTSRGVSAWHDGKAKAGAPCGLRVFMGTLDARLIAL